MNLFDKFRQGLTRTRNFFSDGFKQIQVAMGRFDEEQLDELEMLLIQADVGFEATEQMMGGLRQAMQQERREDQAFVIDYLRQSMLHILGEKRHLQLQKGALNILLMVGVNGSGKTTTTGKLAARYKQEMSVLLAAADTFRAAAIEQLAHWAEINRVPLVQHEAGSDPAAVVYDAIQKAKREKSDLLIIDTAGRLHNKQNLMDELAKIRRIINREAPEAKTQTLLVLDATSGQNALHQAQRFSEISEVTGLVLSKLDGNAKGGIALAVRAHMPDIPIFLAGLGEGVEDLMDFDAAAFVQALLPSDALAEEAETERQVVQAISEGEEAWPTLAPEGKHEDLARDTTLPPLAKTSFSALPVSQNREEIDQVVGLDEPAQVEPDESSSEQIEINEQATDHPSREKSLTEGRKPFWKQLFGGKSK